MSLYLPMQLHVHFVMHGLAGSWPRFAYEKKKTFLVSDSDWM